MRYFAAICLVAASVCAQPLKRGAIVLDVAAEQIVKSETQWQTAWGSFSKDYISSRVLVISLRQLGPGDPTVTVQWYFIGRDYDANKLYIYDSGETQGNIARGGVKLIPASKQLVTNREQSLIVGHKLSGKHPWGWAVFVKQGATALGETASIPELVKWTMEHRGDTPPTSNKQRPVVFVPQALGAQKPKPAVDR